jgi:hypothetical protein
VKGGEASSREADSKPISTNSNSTYQLLVLPIGVASREGGGGLRACDSFMYTCEKIGMRLASRSLSLPCRVAAGGIPEALPFLFV